MHACLGGGGFSIGIVYKKTHGVLAQVTIVACSDYQGGIDEVVFWRLRLRAIITS